ncbi:MAG: hypothetical protein R2861_15955 [Desulfobacterales bacterium]
MVVTLPFVMLLLDYWPLNRIRLNGSENSLKLKLFSPCCVKKYPCSSWLLHPPELLLCSTKGGAVKLLDVVSLAARFYNIPISYIIYIIKTVYPVKLAALPLSERFPWWKVTTAILTLLAVTVLAIRLMPENPILSLDGYFYRNPVPVIGLVQVGDQSIVTGICTFQ